MKQNIKYETNFGKTYLCIKEKMDECGISISEMSHLTGVTYDAVKNYYKNNVFIYNGDILAKFCYVLECDISDILKYGK